MMDFDEQGNPIGRESDRLIESRVGGSFGHRRRPRVRLVEKRGCYAELLSRRTKAAAFRAARELRDGGGWKAPLVVWRQDSRTWVVGSNAAKGGS